MHNYLGSKSSCGANKLSSNQSISPGSDVFFPALGGYRLFLLYRLFQKVCLSLECGVGEAIVSQKRIGSWGLKRTNFK